MILGIDVGTSLGWALTELRDDESVRLCGYGAIKLPTAAGPLANLERVRELFESFGGTVTAVYVEDVPFTKFAKATASYWRVRTLFEIVASDLGLYPFTEVNVSQLKRWATGKGNARKPAMCRAVRERYGVEVYARKDDDQRGKAADEDVADAILVASWAHS